MHNSSFQIEVKLGNAYNSVKLGAIAIFTTAWLNWQWANKWTATNTPKMILTLFLHYCEYQCAENQNVILRSIWHGKERGNCIKTIIKTLPH